MAKPKPEDLVEIEVTVMRKIAPERFKVVKGTLRGHLADEKTLEPSVSLAVARERVRSEEAKTAARLLQKRIAAEPARRFVPPKARA